MSKEKPKLWTMVGPNGTIVIQAPTPTLAAELYPTLSRTNKRNQPVGMTVECKQTSELFRVMPEVRYTANKMER